MTARASARWREGDELAADQPASFTLPGAPPHVLPHRHHRLARSRPPEATAQRPDRRSQDRRRRTNHGPAARIGGTRPIRNWQAKGDATARCSSPRRTPRRCSATSQPIPGEEDTAPEKVVDLTAKLVADGTLRWTSPDGAWQVLRFGCTIGDHSRVSTCSDGWKGYALDVLDAGAFHRYWDAVVEPLIADAGPLAGKTLKYLHTDSWEVEAVNWTPTLREEFRKRRGYDLLPCLPVAGRADRRQPRPREPLPARLPQDAGRPGDRQSLPPFRERAHQHGLQIHPESGGPHAVPIDAQRCLGMNDAPMSEFWAWSWRHRVGDENRFFVKQPASAAHTYGRKLVAAEGFTTIGPHWQETLWDNLKPSFDHACCEGLNLLVWHAFVCSPEGDGHARPAVFRRHAPQSQRHLVVEVRRRSSPTSTAASSCSSRARSSPTPVTTTATTCPNFAQLKRQRSGAVLPGYDYDVITEEVILKRMSCRDGRLVLPDGMSYRVLVLRDHEAISLPVLRKLRELVAAGAHDHRPQAG